MDTCSDSICCSISDRSAWLPDFIAVGFMCVYIEPPWNKVSDSVHLYHSVCAASSLTVASARCDVWRCWTPGDRAAPCHLCSLFTQQLLRHYSKSVACSRISGYLVGGVLQECRWAQWCSHDSPLFDVCVRPLGVASAETHPWCEEVFMHSSNILEPFCLTNKKLNLH